MRSQTKRSDRLGQTQAARRNGFLRGKAHGCRRERWPPLTRRVQSRGGRPRRRCRDSCGSAKTLQTRGIWPACLSRVLIASVLTKTLRTGNPLAHANSVIVATRLPAKGSVLGPPPARNATGRHPNRNSPDRPQLFMNGLEIPKESASTPFVRVSGRPVNQFSVEDPEVRGTNKCAQVVCASNDAAIPSTTLHASMRGHRIDAEDPTRCVPVYPPVASSCSCCALSI